MEIKESIREFKYGSVVLADPNAQFSLTQVRDFFSAAYPQILNAEIEGPEIKANRSIYTFRRAVGTKGGHHVDILTGTIQKQVQDLAALDAIGWLGNADSATLFNAQYNLSHGFLPSERVKQRISELHSAHCSVEERPA
jgi:PRTRC genetic system protein C